MYKWQFVIRSPISFRKKKFAIFRLKKLRNCISISNCFKVDSTHGVNYSIDLWDMQKFHLIKYVIDLIKCNVNNCIELTVNSVKHKRKFNQVLEEIGKIRSNGK